MPSGSLLALLDDITSVLDDVATLTKVAAKKTAGVLGDDLALNAHQVSEVQADRELPVVWAVAKGSLVNKAILVPVALLLATFAPWLVTPLLMVGGGYLCFEGSEKLWHWVASRRAGHDGAAAHHEPQHADASAVAQPLTEKQRVRGAIRTDFILSAEIIIISLGAVAETTFGVRLAVLTFIALLMTVGVYGLVAAIVKLDDFGLYLSRKANSGGAGPLAGAVGRGIVAGAPYLTRSLSVVGTVAMFMVGGGILLHGIPPLAHAVETFAAGLDTVPVAGPLLNYTLPTLTGMTLGLLSGLLLVGVVTIVRRVVR